jgi:large subunit ribosomal protein L16
MGIIPRSFKHKKYFKGKIRTVEKNQKILFGDIAIKAGEPARLTPKQIEAARKAIKKIIKPVGGILKIKVRATLPVTTKPLAVRMGRSKGKVFLNVCPIKKGALLFEISCADAELSNLAAKQGAFRLPLKTLIITKTRHPRQG